MSTSNNLPKPELPENGDYAPFLKIGSITARDRKMGGKITFLGGETRTVEGQFGTQVLVPVKYDGDRFDLGMTPSSGNYSRLYKKFGANAKKWKGVLKFTIKKNLGKDYIAIEI